ncbi:MAG: pyrroline-5-carboxylate reductase [Gammaproteobacteria bacterium]|nr:pyrroline-5-carboxylate reductase [Gammaproteobacteria bacterium]
MNSHSPKLGFIGAGNMGSCLINGLISAGFSPHDIWASNTDPVQLESLKARAIHTTSDNSRLIKESDVILLCVKPGDVFTVCETYRDNFQAHPRLIVSIAAGITTQYIQTALGNIYPIVRCMPNTPAFVQAAVSGLFATSEVSSEQRAITEKIMRSVGSTLWVEKEEQLDAVTALSGSGPAYFLLFMEALRDAGIAIGLSPEDAHFLTLETAFGSAKLALESNKTWATLRQNITSPGGTTEQALLAFTPRLSELCLEAVQAAFKRAKQLGGER